MSDDEETRPRPADRRVQPTPPGVVPPTSDADNAEDGVAESSVWAPREPVSSPSEPRTPADGTERTVQPIPPELVDSASFWATGSEKARGDQDEPAGVAPTAVNETDAARPSREEPDAPKVVAVPPDMQSIPPEAQPDVQAATTAPHEVVIVPSAVPERVDVPPVHRAADTAAPIVPAAATVPAAHVATPPETTVLRSAVPPQASPGGYPAGGAYPGWGAQPPPSSGRSILPLVVLAVVAAMLLGGGVSAWWVARSQDSGAAVVENGATNTTPVVVSTAPPISPTSASMAATTAPPPVATTAPPGANTTTAPTPAPTTAPAPTADTVPGDLGLDQPMRRPPCDGQFIVITANAVTPGRYPDEVTAARRRFVGAAYLRTDQTCSSLRPTDDLGNAIYSVYYGPFPTLARACEIRNQVGGESYVKILDQTTPYTKIWDC